MRIAVENLTKRFGTLAAVSRVSLSVGEGEMFTLLGPSGCGKTTLLRLLACVYAPDEPLSNLDAKIRVQVRAEIRKLQKELGITAVYVTHDQEEALAMSDRIAVFNLGRVCQVGPPKALYERPANRFVADFIGINNLVESRVRSVEGASLKAETALGVLEAIHDAPLKAGERCLICMRPENLLLEGSSGAG